MKKSINYKKMLRTVLPLSAAALVVSCSTTTPAPYRDASSASPAPTAQAESQYHTVRRGETLNSIARTYSQNVADLVAWNHLSDPNQLNVGQTLLVAQGTGEAALASGTAEVRPIAMPGVSSPTGTTTSTPSTPQVVETPQGGSTPYSDEAWQTESAGVGSPNEIAMISPSPEPDEKVASIWQWPASGQVLTWFDENGNKGVDIAGNPGDPVLASAAGNVVYAGSGLRGYGKLVIIKHNDEFLTAYAHNQDLLVKEGEQVKQGQKIAELGSTDADRPKLHFEIRQQGKPVDPAKFLPAR